MTDGGGGKLLCHLLLPLQVGFKLISLPNQFIHLGNNAFLFSDRWEGDVKIFQACHAQTFTGYSKLNIHDVSKRHCLKWVWVIL